MSKRLMMMPREILNVGARGERRGKRGIEERRREIDGGSELGGLGIWVQ